MPATAGRVRMPANNRVHSSAALQTHGIWQSAIGYDPYAPNKNDSKQSGDKGSNSSEPEADNAYASFQGLLALARITGSNADEARGACKKCGRVGHLTFQCRNFLSVKVDDKEKDSVAFQGITSALDKSKVNGADCKAADETSEESSEVDDESDSSDSDADSEIEKIIATRYGKKDGNKTKSLSSKKAFEEGKSDSGERRKRGRSKKRRSGRRADYDSDDEDESHRKSRKDKGRRRHEDSDDEDDGHRHHRKSRKDKRRSHGDSDDEDDGHHRHRKSRKEKKRRRSHRHSDDSDESDESDGHHKRKGRGAASPTDSGSSDSDDSRIGRGKKRTEKAKKHKH